MEKNLLCKDSKRNLKLNTRLLFVAGTSNLEGISLKFNNSYNRICSSSTFQNLFPQLIHEEKIFFKTILIIFLRIFLHRCKQMILQYVVWKPILAIATFVLQIMGLYDEGNFAADRGYLYVTLIYNLSISVSFLFYFFFIIFFCFYFISFFNNFFIIFYNFFVLILFFFIIFNYFNFSIFNFFYILF